jgi:hypothetical protein
MRQGGRLTGGRSWGVLAVALAAGACLLLVAGTNAIGEYRLRHAPACPQSEVFTSTACQVTLDGTVISLSRTEALLEVEGHQLSMPVAIVGPIPDGPIPVQVTLYRGQPVRVEGPGLSVDAAGSYARNTEMFLFFGMAALVVGGTIGGLLLVANARNRRLDVTYGGSG